MKKIITRLSIVAILVTMMFSLTGCKDLKNIIEGNYYDEEKLQTSRKELNSSINNIIETNKKAVNSFVEAERKVFNAKFEEYKGELINAAKIKVLLTVVIPAVHVSGKRDIKVEGDVTSATDINSSKTYSVEFGYDDDGFVNKVEITENE